MNLTVGDPITVLGSDDRSLVLAYVGPTEQLVEVPGGNPLTAHTIVTKKRRPSRRAKRYIIPDSEHVYWVRGHAKTKEARAALLVQFMLELSAL